MSEYETIRSTYESQAIAAKVMSLDQVRHARDFGVELLHHLGLTPERVWELTNPMRLTIGA